MFVLERQMRLAAAWDPWDLTDSETHDFPATWGTESYPQLLFDPHWNGSLVNSPSNPSKRLAITGGEMTVHQKQQMMVYLKSSQNLRTMTNLGVVWNITEFWWLPREYGGHYNLHNKFFEAWHLYSNLHNLHNNLPGFCAQPEVSWSCKSARCLPLDAAGSLKKLLINM